MKVGITGSRHGFSDEQRKAFIAYAAENPMTEFHFGGCKGVDEEAFWLLVELGGGGVPHVHWGHLEEWQMRLTWDDSITLGVVEHPMKHTLARNKDIVEDVDVLLAAPAPSSRGTYYTMDYARKVGVPVIELGVLDDGSPGAS